MTITPDRLDELDFDTPNLLPDPLTDDSPWEFHGYLAFDHADSWCSPSRGSFLGDWLTAWPEPITFTRWDPPLPPVMSKELVVIKPT